jgi:hypothetical protein
MNMLASLRYLAALSEHRHCARAAQSCGITQPALSNALAIHRGGQLAGTAGYGRGATGGL